MPVGTRSRVPPSSTRAAAFAAPPRVPSIPSRRRPSPCCGRGRRGRAREHRVATRRRAGAEHARREPLADREPRGVDGLRRCSSAARRQRTPTTPACRRVDQLEQADAPLGYDAGRDAKRLLERKPDLAQERYGSSEASAAGGGRRRIRDAHVFRQQIIAVVTVVRGEEGRDGIPGGEPPLYAVTDSFTPRDCLAPDGRSTATLASAGISTRRQCGRMAAFAALRIHSSVAIGDSRQSEDVSARSESRRGSPRSRRRAWAMRPPCDP